MRIEANLIYVEVTLYENDGLITKRLFDDDELIKAMDVAVTFCSTRSIYDRRTATVEVYEFGELSESWSFDGLSDPKHKVFD